MSSNPDLTICEKNNCNTESNSKHFLRFTINLRIMNIKLQKGKGSITTSTVMSLPKLNSFRNSTSLKTKTNLFNNSSFFTARKKRHTTNRKWPFSSSKMSWKSTSNQELRIFDSLPEATTTSTLLQSFRVEPCNRQFSKELQLRRTHLFRRKHQVVSWFIDA